MRPLGVVVALVGMTVAPLARAEERSEEQARAIRAFEEKVQEYAALHEKLRAGLGPFGKDADPAEVGRYQQALAKAIVEARAKAAPGDLFLVAVQPIFRSMIEAEFRGEGGARIRETLREDVGDEDDDPHPFAAFARAVNAGYPPGAPLGTAPPSLLRKLPPLPTGALDYRFVGRDLVLRDPVANVVIDLLQDVVPEE